MFTIVYAYRSLEPRVSVRKTPGLRPVTRIVSTKPRGFAIFLQFAHSSLSANCGISSSRRYFSFQGFSLRFMIILFLFFPLISSFLSSPFGMNKFFPFLGQIVHGHPPPLSGSSIMFSLSAFLAIFPLAGSFLSLSHKRAFLAICPLAGSLFLSLP